MVFAILLWFGKFLIFTALYFLIRKIFENANIYWDKGCKLITIIIAFVGGWRVMVIMFLCIVVMQFGKDFRRLRDWMDKNADW